MPVRLKDIALELGVSVVTVSKVLRNHSDISAETRQRVLERMKQLNYRPNLAARALVTGKSNMIGFVVPDLLHPFFAEVAKGLTKILRKKGYCLVIASSEEDPELERQEIEHLLARRVDALVVASAQNTAESFTHAENQKTPFVLIDRFFEGLSANYIGVDDERAGYLATRHLIEQGCKRIAHIRGPQGSAALGREIGYKKAINEVGQAEMIVASESTDEQADTHGSDAMNKLLNFSPRPDGVFCFNDPNAIGALTALHAARVKVPDEIAVIGVGNLHYDGLLRVPLSSVDQDSSALGEEAAKLALRLIETKSLSRPKSVLLEPTLLKGTRSNPS